MEYINILILIEIVAFISEIGIYFDIRYNKNF